MDNLVDLIFPKFSWVHDENGDKCLAIHVKFSHGYFKPPVVLTKEQTWEVYRYLEKIVADSGFWEDLGKKYKESET